MIFETKRLIIRKFECNDLEAFYDMVGDPEVMRYIKPPLNYEQSKNELNRFMRYYKSSSDTFLIWAAIDKENEVLVGLCGYYLNNDREFEIAYRLRKRFWGKGMGKELAEGILDYLVRVIRAKKVVAYVSKNNMASVNILNKLMKKAVKKNTKFDTNEEKYIWKATK